MNKPQQGVILCGGLGTRLLPYTKDVPKPMILCNGKPFLWYLLQQLNEQGIERFLLLTGYLSQEIINYFGDGSKWGWIIDYSEGPIEWDTGKRVWEANEMLDDLFLLLYSDNFITFNLEKYFSFYKKNNLPLSLILTNKDFGNILLDKNERVIAYNNQRSMEEFKYVDIGYMIIEKEVMFGFYENPECNFNKVLKKMISSNSVSALTHANKHYSISDKERWKITEKYLEKKKIILIDRDGVINKRAPKGEYINNWYDFEWIQETYEFMLSLSKKGFSFIIITNQAGIARGITDLSELEKIHENLKERFLLDGIDILDIYYCPHHWNDNCTCRKPNSGMFIQASKDWLLRLDRTIYIGDDPRDCSAAYNADCTSIFIGDITELDTLPKSEKPLYAYNRIKDAYTSIQEIYEGYENL
ncbi:MAG: HAD-IIIA family hydrolase [Gammaproteobacteria bacterium]|nr:HAD-IIIA family hydrolase [Gammaproteobacteria bacterium]